MSAPAELVVARSAQQLASDAAARLVATLAAAQRLRGTASLVVTGGGILEQTLRALRLPAARDAVDWAKVSLWWGDERFVARDSPERNDLAAFRAIFDDLPLDPPNVHRMPAADGRFGEDAEAAADAYAAELALAVPPGQGDDDVPHFDVVLLGVGPDGHCASLFPEHPGVYETTDAVIAVRNAPKPPPTRISLTFRALDAANEIWFVASGESKAQAVAMALSGAGRVQVPAAGPHGRRRTLWLIDREAAAKLSTDPDRPPLA
jgi:6-phosphogluconolactonase